MQNMHTNEAAIATLRVRLKPVTHIHTTQNAKAAIVAGDVAEKRYTGGHQRSLASFLTFKAASMVLCVVQLIMA